VGVEVMPFADEHLDVAAGLLAERHRRDRVREPDLPARFEEPGAARALLKELLAWPVARGVIARRGQRPVGFLLGGALLTPPKSRHAFFLPARSGYAPFATRWRRTRIRTKSTRRCTPPSPPTRDTFHAANVVARRFWLDCGFRPVKRRLSRRIDERAARVLVDSRRSP
jgi:hypothetical protein